MLGWLLLPATLLSADVDGIEFFENKIRPALVEHCYKCHSAKATKLKGGLRLDSRAALLKGGDTGPALVPGSPEKSLLVEAISFKNVDLQMPPRGKLPDTVVADFTKWIAMGAPWPDEKGTKTASDGAGFDLERRKKEHWCWQPVRRVAPPKVKQATGSDIDRFILAKLEAKGLTPAARAEPRILLRRLYFDLIGLPPSASEVAAWDEGHAKPQAVEQVVDQLLASPHFGERWGRHWLDLTRYAESRGHEFDYPAPNAFQYRDYVIRALNADVPYDQFVLEHLAGDLLTKPRRHPTEGWNESILGTGFYFLGEQVHSPVDTCQDKADRFDNMIDVMTKSFLGLTVSCARCHDHKFDAISTKDYYALFGFLESSGYRLAPFDTAEHNHAIAAEITKLHESARAELLGSFAKAVDVPTPASDVVVDWSKADAYWLTDGPGFRKVRPGDVRLGTDVKAPTVRVYDFAGAVTDPIGERLKLAAGTENDPGPLGQTLRYGRTLHTPKFTVRAGKVYYLVRGAGRVFANVDGHVMISGPLHGNTLKSIKTGPKFQWLEHDLSRYVGRRAHLEISGIDGQELAIVQVVQATSAPMPCDPTIAPPDSGPVPAAWIAKHNELLGQLKTQTRLAPAIIDNSGVDEYVFIRGTYKGVGETVPRRFLEACAGPDPIAVKRGSGRLELARQIVDPERNPLVSRVLVNRLWHHLFGRGLVASVDNFGVLGEMPSHPELLDYLADRFVKEGWSLKKMIRALVLTDAYQRSSMLDDKAAAVDPRNELLQRMNLRRLEGEAIRDALLTVSGRLDRRQFGPPVPVHLTSFQEGRGRPASGPVDGDGRRSIYVSVKRNFLSSFLLAFDTPIPFSSVGRRTKSNVPAQALILLNDPFVHQQSGVWAKSVLAQPGSTQERVGRMYLAAFARTPTPEEVTACCQFVDSRGNDAAAWGVLAHALINTKEFIFVQ